MGLGDFISGIFGSKNEEKVNTPAVDPNAYNYGGREGGAAEDANRYRQNAANAQNRQAAQADYSQSNRATSMSLDARRDMNKVGQAQLSRALGKVPSIAQMQADRQMGQAAAQQGALAASARGRGGLANASMTAANNTANLQSGISNQAQINGANERMQAEQAAAGTFGNLQGADLARAGMLGQQAQYQATNQMQQRQLNDAMTNSMTQNEMAVNMAQLGASQNLQAQQSGNKLQAGAINAGVGGQNAAMNQSNAMGMIGMAANTAGGLAGMKADGGPVAADKPYLVGERGPELIVPKKDAVVIPAPQTQGLLSRALGPRTIDLDRDVDIDNDPGAQDFDADEYIESKAPKPYEREGQTTRHDTKAETARVQREVQDQAAREADAMMAGYAAALKQGPAVAARDQSPPDLRLAARADGGPLAQGQPGLVGEQGPELVVPQLATWGRGTSVEGVGELTRDQYANEAARVQNEAKQAPESPYERDVRRHKALVAMGDREGAAMVAPEARRSGAIVRAARNTPASEEAPKEDAAERQAVSEGKKAPPSLRSRIGKAAIGSVADGATKIAGGVDVGYHGPTSVQMPQLIPVQAPPRAAGGPMMGGSPYTVGEQGPELVVPSVGGFGGGANFGGTFGGGANAIKGGGMNTRFGTEWNNSELRGMSRGMNGVGYGGAREGGGPVQKGKAYLVGEKGREAVIPKTDLQRAAQEAQDHADEVEENHQRNLRTAAFAEKIGAPVTRNPIDFHRDSPEQQAVIARNAPPAPPPAHPAKKEDEEVRADLPLGAFLASLFGGRT